METTTELQLFLAMLDRAGLAYGKTNDYSPFGTGIHVEHDDEDDECAWWETSWQFDGEGKLVSMRHSRGMAG